jgi:hypothetical protein
VQPESEGRLGRFYRHVTGEGIGESSLAIHRAAHQDSVLQNEVGALQQANIVQRISWHATKQQPAAARRPDDAAATGGA